MLPESIFSIPLTLGGDYDFSGMPILYRNSYEGKHLRIGDVPCVVVSPKSQLKLVQIEALCQAIRERDSLPCLVHAEEATAYQRRAMTERGISWLSTEHTFSIPFIAASCNERELRRRHIRAFRANAQRVAVGAISGELMGMTTTDVANALEVSLSSAVNYLSEVAAVCPGLVSSRGRTRFLNMPDMTREELYATLRPFMSSPVKERVFLKLAESDRKAFEVLPLSGTSALSLRTEITDDPWQTRALYGAVVEEVFPASTIVGEFDQPDALVEMWRYQSGQEGEAVGEVSLLIELEELGDTGDERFEAAIEALRKGALS